jgi:hypothetical protein
MDSLKPAAQFAEIVNRAVERLEEAGRELVGRKESGSSTSSEEKGGSPFQMLLLHSRVTRTDTKVLKVQLRLKQALRT